MKFGSHMRTRISLIYLLGFGCLQAVLLHAQASPQANLVQIDAVGTDTPETPVAAGLGAFRSPSGQTIGATTQNLTLNGQPWIPVLGELHYSRVPEAEWETDILRMKSAGVNVIASYVIWIHQEQDEGHFVWTGNKDLRHFAELCAKNGMYFYPRIGPWSHAEVRNGGLPDWVAAQPHTRENDPRYLAAVTRFYNQIGKQLQGLYWKDGGPIIGLQIENEYHATGAGKGSDHIRMLKSLAIAAGMDVPLYTVTGWDSAVIPLDAVLPVFGGYPDAPWDVSRQALPPSEIYAFRYHNRARGSMQAVGGDGQSPASVYNNTPFLTAEIGDGNEDTYLRRPVITSDDVAAILPVMLGSGVNMLGYYMFAGGRNPDGGSISLQESQRTGYPTDVPVKSYDFQAPISNNGKERDSLRRLKLVNYFVNDFGAQLAAMRVRQPSVTPSSAGDLSVPRVSARTKGDSGFIFLNNHVRNSAMPARPQFQVQLNLAGEVMRIPEKPITLPSDTYGIWPVNLDLNGIRIRYSTAQLVSRLDLQAETFVFFFALPGVVPEFLLSAPGEAVTVHGFVASSDARGTRLRAVGDSGDMVVNSAGGTLHLIVLSEADAMDLWKVDDGRGVLLTKADVFSDGSQIDLEQEGNSAFEYRLFHAGAGPLFTEYRDTLQPVSLKVAIHPISTAHARTPIQDGLPTAPEDKDFAQAAAQWLVTLGGDLKAPQLAEVMIRIRYQGDVARLLQNGHLLDDDFCNGTPWEVGAKWAGLNAKAPFDLQILPLPSTANSLSLESVEAMPRYRFTFNSSDSKQVSQLAGRLN